MFCVNCGAKLEDNSRFCAMCGTPAVVPVQAEPVAEEAPAAPVVVETPAEPVVEEAPVVPVVEETPVAPVVEEAPVVPVVEETPVAPVVEEAPVAPVTEEAPVAPVVEEAPVAPVVEEAPVAPVTEEAPVAPVVEEAPVAPVVEEAPVAPVVEEAPVAPVVEEAPAAPVVEEAPAAPVVEEAPVAPAPQPKEKVKAKKVQSAKRKPHIVARIMMQLLSFILCLVLAASLIGTVVLADLNHIMSKNGIQQLVNAVLNPTPAPQRVIGAAGVLFDDGGFTIPDDMDVSDIPEDILTGGDSEENVSNLVSWLYQAVAESSDKPLKITEEQVQAFVQESNISDYIADKLAGYADDFVNNTENTTITTDEIMSVLEENEALIEEKFDIEITGETKAELEASVNKLVVEQDLNGAIRQQVFTAVEDAINESVSSTGLTWDQIQPVVQVLCSDITLYIAIGICVVLMLLILCLNFYNVPGGLTWIAVPCIVIGGIFTAALAMASMLPKLIPAIPAAVVQVITPFTAALLPVHGAVLGFGLLLLIVSIVWRVIRSAVRRKQEASAV